MNRQFIRLSIDGMAQTSCAAAQSECQWNACEGGGPKEEVWCDYLMIRRDVQLHLLQQTKLLNSICPSCSKSTCPKTSPVSSQTTDLRPNFSLVRLPHSMKSPISSYTMPRCFVTIHKLRMLLQATSIPIVNPKFF